ncbi:hypothetical protein GGI00_002777 [Coemansia sp. RSA 2681]|nr:hypothetical protein GGI00_002777 [Coemansia sp. RSA 2681]
MTFYCLPVFPISRKRQLLHCDICRWEGVAVARVRVDEEPRSNRRHRQASSAGQDQTRDIYIPEDSMQPRPPQFQTVAYTENEYQAPPPPYSKGPEPKSSKQKPAPNTATAPTATAQED